MTDTTYMFCAAPQGNASSCTRVSGVVEAHDLRIPDLKYESFDKLMDFVDGCIKLDSGLEAKLRAIERIGEDTGDDELKIYTNKQPNGVPVEHYLKTFEWDKNKFPLNRKIDDLVQSAQFAVSKCDDLVKNRAGNYSELKNVSQQYTKNASLSLASKDLVEVFSPTLVNKSDFINSQTMQTMLVVIPSASEGEFFEKVYDLQNEDGDQLAIADSHMKFSVTDKDNNSIFRVVVFRKFAEEFAKRCRAERWSCREFEYSADAYQQYLQDKAKIAQEMQKAEYDLKEVVKSAYSDVCQAWIHVKAIRLYVDALLRYGRDSVRDKVSPCILKVKVGKEAELKTALGKVLSDPNAFGQEYIGDVIEGDAEVREYHSFSLVYVNAKAQRLD